ncbi:RHS repeat-associated core domain-containing protein [Elizabethkingia anophelis subsp. anophelis]|uniref:RHS repeat-associated core domain-containing protein n=1 Tax=Elizabethkingia anophelis TaxID=1117645 RepID=UPI0031409774
MKDLQKDALLQGANRNDINIDVDWNELPDTPYGTLGTIPFHDTTGQIDVNGGGQLQYTLPIALPPGVKSVAPQINLMYDSGSGNGIAGYGWNISGITAISRMGKTIEKDGEVKGIQLDYSDFYQFNGQRLILKSGEYGKDGAEYVTEKYSNIKIKSVGTNSGMNGPRYFEVTFEDGSQAWYGRTPSGNTEMEQYAATPVEYNIVKWIDAQGNYITYKYVQGDRVAIIYSIEWGGNKTAGTPHFNKIDFNYIRRDLREITYLNGDPYIQNYILSNIEVNANGSLFKKYSIEYKKDDKGNGYQFVKSITESNSSGENATPVTFDYQESKSGGWRDTWISNDNNTDKLFGDFDGDGKMDVLKYMDPFEECIEFEKVEYGDNGFRNSHFGKGCTKGKPMPGGLYLLSSAFDNLSPKEVHTGNLITKEEFKRAKAFNIKTLNGEVLPRQGIVTYNTIYSSGLDDKKDLEIKAFSIDINKQLKEEFTRVIPGSLYDDTVSRDPNADPRDSQYWAQTEIDNIEEIDLDGDGVSDLIFVLRDTTYREVNNTDHNGNLQVPELVIETRYRYLIIQPGESDPQKLASTLSIGPFYNDNFFQTAKKGDFNGDGVVDFITFSSTGRAYLTTFKKNSSGIFTVETNMYSDMVVEGLRKDALIGDFTGDGKTDLLVPQAEFSWSWKLYTSTGNGFKVQTLDNFAWFRRSNEFPDGKTHVRYMNRHFFAQDLNKDGKADFIEFYSHVYSGDFTESRFFVRYHENKGLDANGNIVFEEQNIDGSTQSYRSSYKWDWYPDEYGNIQTNVQPYALSKSAAHFSPVIGDFRINNFNESILVFQQGRLVKYSHYKVSDEARITSITQGGITTEIDYKELDPNINKGFYEKAREGKQYSHPYVELDKVSGSYAVSQLRQEGRKQDFKYRGFTAHLQGKGMIGFRKTARSSWYADGCENTKIWSGVEIDPLNEGVSIKEWSVRTVDDNSLIFTSDISFNDTQLLSSKSTDYDITTSALGVKAIVPKKTVTKDFLKDITTESSVIYGDYYLPKETITKVNGDFAVTTTVMDYVHNPNGLASNYFIGRLALKTETVQAYGDVKSAKEEYEYENNLIKALKTYNRDNSGWVQENFTYDLFGNIIAKSIINSVNTIIQNQKSSYDFKGRFIIKKIDNLGLETIIDYNDWGQVKVQTEPLGDIINNIYDSWGKLLMSKTNLGGTTTYTYEKFSDGGNRVIEYASDGSSKENYTNKLGQKYKVRTKGLNSDGVIRSSEGIDYIEGERKNTYVSISTKYDVLGRKTAESEPYFDLNSTSIYNETPKWNTISYNDSIFPAEITAKTFNGKEIKTLISGHTTIVEELNGYKRVTKKTTDALDNVISSEDKGGVIHFSFNAAGEQISAQYGNNTVTTQFDVWGRKSQFHDPSNGLYTYEYNGFGQVKKEISPRGYKEYSYNDKGQLINLLEKSNITGLTDKNISFNYNGKGLLISKTGTSNGKAYFNTVVYDTFGRVLESTENSNDRIYTQKDIVYDNKSRVVSYKKSLLSSGVATEVQIENVYEAWSGQLYQVKDKTNGRLLWELQNSNAKGQVLRTRLGASTIENTYDANDFLNQTLHSSSKSLLFDSQYSFDAVQNELKERTRQGDFVIREVFTYDDNNRLVQWTNPKTGRLSSNKYDLEGRITENDQIGTIQFGDIAKKYQPTGAKLSTISKQNYLNSQIQRIIYNENNDPLYIQSKKGDVRFEYGLIGSRQVVTFGAKATGAIDNLAISDWEGAFTKYYSEDGSFEVVRNNATGEEKHILYVGGTPYESNVVYLKDFTQSRGSYKFLHKDYLGSIMAISDEEGNLVQETHYDPWGQLVNGSINILDRGYTGHEHFEDIGIIHMNGRLYDPLLRRFLNADENIQDPYNTQIYNKYGYVMNNPLMYNDPSGEFIFAFLGLWAFWKAVIIGAAIGLASYTAGLAITGNLDKWNIGGALKAVFWGAVSGAVTFGIGSIFSTGAGTAAELTKFANSLGDARIFVQGGMHAISQGVLSAVQGGDFWSAALSGLAGHFGAEAWGASMKGLGLTEFANSTTGMVAFGALAGGVGAELSGGNFWQGAITGGIVAGLNSAMHKVSGPGDGRSKANIYIETDGVGHVYIEVDGVVYSYGRYNGSYSPASGSLGPYGDGILMRLDGEKAANFITDRTSKYPTAKYSVEVDGGKVKSYYDKLYNRGKSLQGKTGYFKYGRVIDTYSLAGPGGNNCTTIVYKALNYGGANIGAPQTPAGILYNFRKADYIKQGYNPGRHIWGPK